jgi:hypothetical protein
MAGREDVEDRRRYNQPYTHKNTIPTIQKYREEKDRRREQAGNIDEDNGEDGEDMSRLETAKRYWYGERHEDDQAQPEGEGEQDAKIHHKSIPILPTQKREGRLARSTSQSVWNEKSPIQLRIFPSASSTSPTKPWTS